MPALSFEQIQRAVRDYCRDYIRAQRERGRSYHEIARRLEVSHVWILRLAKGEENGSRGAGGKIEHQLAQVLHGGSIDELRRAALNVQLGGLVILEDDGRPVEVRPPEAPVTTRPRRKRSR